jgi:hypothetical protein
VPDLAQAHIDGCTYIGPASLKFAQKLLEWDAKVQVPTTLNAISVDLARKSEFPEELGGPAASLAEAGLRSAHPVCKSVVDQSGGMTPKTSYTHSFIVIHGMNWKHIHI